MSAHSGLNRSLQIIYTLYFHYSKCLTSLPIEAVEHGRPSDLVRWTRLLELMGLWPENQGKNP